MVVKTLLWSSFWLALTGLASCRNLFNEDYNFRQYDDVDRVVDEPDYADDRDALKGYESEGVEVVDEHRIKDGQQELKELLKRQLRDNQEGQGAPGAGGDYDDPQEDDEDDYDPYSDNFYDQHPDGSYEYGYSLPGGVRRYERGFYSSRSGGLVVEGFYTQARNYNQRLLYELRCYRSDINGYRPLSVQYLRRSPTVRRDGEPDVDCFN